MLPYPFLFDNGIAVQGFVPTPIKTSDIVNPLSTCLPAYGGIPGRCLGIKNK
jgi:hypothetical protein